MTHVLTSLLSTGCNLFPHAQVNYLGPYSLTRLLEAKLVACRTRVVTVSSVTHRSYELPRDPRDFVHTTARVTYAWTKLANVGVTTGRGRCAGEGHGQCSWKGQYYK